MRYCIKLRLVLIELFAFFTKVELYSTSVCFILPATQNVFMNVSFKLILFIRISFDCLKSFHLGTSNFTGKNKGFVSSRISNVIQSYRRA